ncbi:MAG: aminotransferase class V-fold PLP-dependent enzyme [Actinomycetota bacterium]|nr:aminotransferase class V-fold PLP-dependent enzyme [Actinomycetota bacterium]
MVAIPGPSIIPDRVLAAMHRAMPNIYEGDIIDVSQSVIDELPSIARTEAPAYIAIANGHGAWEMAITNTLSAGDKVLVLESGRFAIGWGEMARSCGADVEILPGTPRHPVDPAAVEARLAADTGREIRAVLVVQIDTASSVHNDIAAIRAAMDAADHPALLLVDCIASMGCVPYEMDAWGVDVTVAASQKGLMVPPGLGFVWANGRAHEANRTAGLRTAYWDWTPRAGEGAHYLRYCGTPPVQMLWGLREALDMIAEEGLENVWARHATLAGAVRAAIDAWSAPAGLEPFVAEPSARSNAVTTVLTGSIDAEHLRKVCEVEAGLTLGLALAGDHGPAFRIGHMGHLNPPMILGTLGTIEAGLAAIGAPTGGSGAAAAAAHVGAAMR